MFLMPMPLKRSKKGKKYLWSYKRDKKQFEWDSSIDLNRRSKAIGMRPEDLHVSDLPEKGIMSAKGIAVLNKNFEGKRPSIRCPRCGHTWKIRVQNPQRCPKCGYHKLWI